MSATVIQTKATQDYRPASESLVVTLDSATAAGNTLIGSFGADGDAVSAVTDDAGNAWTRIASTNDEGAQGQRRGQLWYSLNASPVNTVYITSTDGQNVLAAVSEWQGITGLRSHTAANTPTGRTTTNAQAGDLVFAPCYYYSASGSPELTPETGWQSAGSVVRGSMYHSTAYRTATADGMSGPLWDIGAAGKATITAAFTTVSGFDESNVHVRVNGAWKKAISHIRLNGAWVPSGAGGSTPDPGDGGETPAGWATLYDSTFEANDGWTARQETQANDNSYNTPNNVLYGASGMRVLGKREEMGNRPYTSGDVLGQHIAVPNYFRAEVTATLPIEPGMWPAPLWFRPLNGTDGEIDVCETWPYDWAGDPKMHATIWENYVTKRKENAGLSYSALANPDPAAPHTYVVEKTYRRIRFEVDGVLVYEWNESNFNPTIASWYDSIYEVAGRTWYPRVTLQIGAGNAGTAGNNAEPDSSWQQSEVVIHQLKIYQQA